VKIAIINDTHFGVRNDSQLFLDNFLNFFKNQFFPYIKKNEINTIIHLGDFVDRRKYVNFNTLNRIKSEFFEEIKKLDVSMHMIIGNHDTFYKNTNEINSPKELFSDYDFLKIYETPNKVVFGSCCIDMVPWICKENKDEVVNFIKNSKSDILCGHLELSNHEVMRGVRFHGGMGDDIFSNYNKVLSGHFHIKSKNKNIFYLGTQYQLTFADANEIKGFHILDTEDLSLEFIENKDKMFYIIKDTDEIKDFSLFKNRYVKYIIDETVNNETLMKIEESNPYDLTVFENYEVKIEDKKVDLGKDTLTIINEEIDQLEIDLNKNELKTLIREVYLEALEQ